MVKMEVLGHEDLRTFSSDKFYLCAHGELKMGPVRFLVFFSD